MHNDPQAPKDINAIVMSAADKQAVASFVTGWNILVEIATGLRGKHPLQWALSTMQGAQSRLDEAYDSLGFDGQDRAHELSIVRGEMAAYARVAAYIQDDLKEGAAQPSYGYIQVKPITAQTLGVGSCSSAEPAHQSPPAHQPSFSSSAPRLVAASVERKPRLERPASPAPVLMFKEDGRVALQADFNKALGEEAANLDVTVTRAGKQARIVDLVTIKPKNETAKTTMGRFEDALAPFVTSTDFTPVITKKRGAIEEIKLSARTIDGLVDGVNKLLDERSD